MSITAEEYAKSGKVDAATSHGISHAIAEAGKEWGELLQANPNLSDAEKLEAAQRIASGAVKKEDMFLESAGTRELVDRYNQILIERSYAKDEQDGVAKGTHLMAYLTETSKAVDGVDFEKVKRGDFSGLNGKTLQGIKAEISQAAHAHVGLNGTVEEDFLGTLQDDKTKQKYTGATVEPKAMGGGLIQMIMTFISELLGIDLAGMFAINPPEAKNKLDENHLSFSPEMEKKFNELLPAATRLRDGKEAADDIKIVEEFAGIKDAERRELNDEQRKALGGKILDEAAKLRTGQITEKDMVSGIQAEYSKGASEQRGDQKDVNDPSPTAFAMVPDVLVGMVKDGIKTVVNLTTLGMVNFEDVKKFAQQMPKSEDTPEVMPLPQAEGTVRPTEVRVAKAPTQAEAPTR